MTLKFYVYEDTSALDMEISNEHSIVKVLECSDSEAMILGAWFNHKDSAMLDDTVYHSCTGSDLLDVFNTLDVVLNESDEYLRVMLAQFYFPTMYRVPNNVYNPLMFSSDYFNALSNVYDELLLVFPEDTVANKERVFFYNWSWI